MTPLGPGDVLAAARQTVARAVRSGHRTVVLTASRGQRFGNVLYFWLHAHVESRPGRPWVVQVPPDAAPWLVDLPALRALSVDRPGPRDRRMWPPERLWQRFGDDFTRADVDSFVRTILLPSPLLATEAPGAMGRVVVNIRRGDYYAVPGHRANYGFDVPAYVHEALDRMAARAPVTSLLVVSDDPAWCRDHLGALGADRGLPVTVAELGTPREHFATLCHADRLVGANSTFSYWAAHVITTRLGERAHIVMPRFHARHVNNGRADQLDPAWDVVEELAGGWAER